MLRNAGATQNDDHEPEGEGMRTCARISKKLRYDSASKPTVMCRERTPVILNKYQYHTSSNERTNAISPRMKDKTQSRGADYCKS